MIKKTKISKEFADTLRAINGEKYAMVEIALEDAGYKDIKFISGKFSVTAEDNGGKPKEIAKLVASRCPIKNGMRADQLNVRRREGRMHLDFSNLVFGDVEKPLTVDREIPLRESEEIDNADDLMGGHFMYVYDMFNELYGAYPENLSNREDYRRLGHMMNLVIAGHRFDV